MKKENYKPALIYDWLTSIYDPLIGLTLRERTFKEHLIRLANINVGQKVLDVGCGTGTLTLMIKDFHPESEVVGIDGDENVLKIAREKRKKIGKSVQLDFGLATKLPYAEHSFDHAFSSLVFHHLSSDEKASALKEIYRVLKPDGHLYVADFGKPTTLAMRTAFYLVQIFDGFDTTSDNVSGKLPEFFSRAGFSDVKIAANYSTIVGTLSLFKARKLGHIL